MPPNLLKDVVSVRHLGGHRIWLRFEDGVEGEIDLRKHLGEFRGVMRPLQDPAFVARVFIQPDFKTVTWPGELDLDPVVLYCAVQGIPVPTYEEKPRRRAKEAEKSVQRDRPTVPVAKGRRRRAGTG